MTWRVLVIWLVQFGLLKGRHLDPFVTFEVTMNVRAKVENLGKRREYYLEYYWKSEWERTHILWVSSFNPNYSCIVLSMSFEASYMSLGVLPLIQSISGAAIIHSLFHIQISLWKLFPHISSNIHISTLRWAITYFFL